MNNEMNKQTFNQNQADIGLNQNQFGRQFQDGCRPMPNDRMPAYAPDNVQYASNQKRGPLPGGGPQGMPVDS